MLTHSLINQMENGDSSCWAALADFISAAAQLADGSTANSKFQRSILSRSEHMFRSEEQRKTHYVTFWIDRQILYMVKVMWSRIEAKMMLAAQINQHFRSVKAFDTGFLLNQWLPQCSWLPECTRYSHTVYISTDRGTMEKGNLH